MPSYVPDFKYDIFVSYSHVSDEPGRLGWRRGWVTTFVDDLHGKLKASLGEVSIWIDKENLRKSANYVEKIEEEVKASAILLTINCGPYLNSTFCDLEVRLFRESWGDSPATERPIAEIYQCVLPSRGIPKLRADHNGFMFCGDPGRNRNETGEPLPRDNPKYEKALSRAAAEITDMLYKMRLAKESIFLSVPVALHQKNHLKTFFHGLRAELAQRYRVEVGLSAGDHAAMAEAKLSVHFIGQERDDRTVDLIDIAIGGDRPCVIFSVSEGTGEPSGPMAVYREYLEGRMRESTPNKISVSAVTPGKYTISEIVRWMGELIPKHASDTVRLKPKLVYLMCHPDCSKDSDFLRVRDLLAKEECLRLSSADTRDPADYYRYHLRTFGECDGLMLFWGGTDTGWFQKWYGSVKNWRPYRNGKPFKSKAVCLLPPPQQKRESIKSDLLPDELVLEFFLDNDFSSLRLESFIEPLRPVRR